jgi:Cu-processing system permease protein
LPRPAYLLGKFLGFAVVATAIAFIATLPVALLAPADAAAAWGLSLALELLLVSAVAVFCITTFTQLLSGAAFVAAFYLLARSISAIQLMSTSSLVADGATTHKLGEWLANAMAFVLPRLDTFTQTAWLLPEGTPAGLGGIALQSAVYVALLLTAAMFDLYRRNF